jgi:Fe-Mn family superoxide dismutase
MRSYMYKLPVLPYSLKELEPVISEEIMNIHYHKHHQGYVDKLNEIIHTYNPELFETMNETTMAMYINTFPEETREKLKNQLGGHINHSFFWGMMTKKDTSAFKLKMDEIFKDTFGSTDQAVEELISHALYHFGSGWTWICYNPINENLEIRNYKNQDTPLFDSMYPVLGIDLWEHAYYLQYKNEKKKYIESWSKLINWEYVFELWHSYHENTLGESHEHCGTGCC